MRAASAKLPNICARAGNEKFSPNQKAPFGLERSGMNIYLRAQNNRLLLKFH
jgi:hypothetical protein